MIALLHKLACCSVQGAEYDLAPIARQTRTALPRPTATKEDERDEAGFLTLRRIETSLINFLFIIESKLEGRMQS
jgi:hypothetical protein